MSADDPPHRPDDSEADAEAQGLGRAPAPDLAQRVEQARLHAELRTRLFGEPRRAVSIGRYEVQHKLGQGGSGTVFAVHDPAAGCDRALKLVESGDARALARLRREARAMAALEHPHIVRVHDVGQHDHAMFVVMDLVLGTTLRAWLGTPRPWRAVLACLLPVADGLALAHARGILHRDVKPDNVLVEPPAHAWLLDFGLAKPLPASEAAALTHMSQVLTRTGTVLGTVGYIAPELLMGQPAAAAADQFSLCVMLWEALHGQPPFVGATADAIGLAALRGEIEAAAPGRVPTAIEAVLRRGLHPDPSERHASVAALADALRHASTTPAPRGWLARWRRRPP